MGSIGRLAVFLPALLAAQLACGTSETELTFTSSGYFSLRAENTGNVSKCVLETNKAEKFEYTPNFKHITERISSYSSDTCTVTIQSDIEAAGKWKITQHARKENGSVSSQEFAYTAIYEAAQKLIPDSSLLVYEGYYASAEMQAELGNVTSCTVQTPSNEMIDLLAADRGKNPERFGGCGFRLLANASHTGKWSFRANVTGFRTYTSVLRLHVLEEKKLPNETKTIVLMRGRSGAIELEQPYTQFCQLEDPTGKKLPVAKKCYHEIPVVTALHEGVWTAHYAVEGRLHLRVLSIRVLTSEPSELGTNVTLTEDGDFKVSCHVRLFERQEFGSCRFVRPDGTILSMSPGVGTERYFAAQVPRASDLYNDMYCTLVIRKPEAVDIGAWRCGISSRYGRFLAGTVFQVEKSMLRPDGYADSSSAPRNLNIAAPDVYVKRGDSFSVKCRANAVLGYCWLRSPNGTAYSVSYGEKGTAPFTLVYEGAGLSLGECGAKIEAAVYTDHGEWSCNLGVVNATEERRTASVTVTESYLVAVEPEVVPLGETTVLSCRILPRMEEKAVRYCRWVRPDGHGIYNDAGDRYRTAGDRSRCKLNILGSIEPEDYGRWRCVAGLEGFNLEEAWAEVEVQPRGSSIGVLLGVAVSACIAVSAVVSGLILMNLRRRQRTDPEKPPAYEAAVGVGPRPADGKEKSRPPAKEFKY